MRMVLSLLLVLALCGCQTAADTVSRDTISDEAAFAMARKAVVSQLRDPSSAQFGPRLERRFVMSVDVVCGTVNAKNGYGGYTGQTIFAYRVGHDRAVFFGEVDQADPFRPANMLCS